MENVLIISDSTNIERSYQLLKLFNKESTARIYTLSSEAEFKQAVEKLIDWSDYIFILVKKNNLNLDFYKEFFEKRRYNNAFFILNERKKNNSPYDINYLSYEKIMDSVSSKIGIAKYLTNINDGFSQTHPSVSSVQLLGLFNFENIIPLQKEMIPKDINQIEEEPQIEERSLERGAIKDIPVEEAKEDIPSPNNKYVFVKLFFGTDRKYQGSDKAHKVFTNESDKLNFGECIVSIPSSHKIGEIETPWRNFRLLENPSKHIILQEVDLLTKQDIFKKINAGITESNNNSALLFIHGYNISFEESAKRTAQLTIDLNFEGVKCFYSWPSKAKTELYTHDEEAIQVSTKYITEFLIEFSNQSLAENIYLIGHSMGTRGLTKALIDAIEQKPEIKDEVKEIILSAPDINAKIFKEQIVPEFLKYQKVITLYASSEDKPLQASKAIHGFPRAGETGEEIIIMDGVETIDATGADTSFMKHSYYGDARAIINDLHNLILDRERPDKRVDLMRVKIDKGAYWKFRK